MTASRSLLLQRLSLLSLLAQSTVVCALSNTNNVTYPPHVAHDSNTSIPLHSSTKSLASESLESTVSSHPNHRTATLVAIFIGISVAVTLLITVALVLLQRRHARNKEARKWSLGLLKTRSLSFESRSDSDCLPTPVIADVESGGYKLRKETFTWDAPVTLQEPPTASERPLKLEKGEAADLPLESGYTDR